MGIRRIISMVYVEKQLLSGLRRGKRGGDGVIETLIGRRFWLYPWNTYRNEGILLSVDEHGFCFKITKANDPKYKVGDIYFVSKGQGVTCVLIEEVTDNE